MHIQRNTSLRKHSLTELPITPSSNFLHGLAGDVSNIDTVKIAVVLSRPSAITDEKSRTWAYRLLWFTFILFFTGTGFGKLWDRIWHLTHVFDTFWSPPHLFVSGMTATTGFLAITLAFVPYFRSHFGPFIRIPLFKVEVAGSLIFLGGGLTTLSMSILLDALWHTTFGFDETQWS